MKQQRRLTALVMMIMLFALFACSPETAEGESDADTGATDEAGGEEEPRDAEPADASDEPLTIGVLQLVEHPSLDLHVDGMVDRLEQEGYAEGDGVTVDVQFAQGDISLANSIAARFVGDEVDVLVAVATPSAQAAVNAARDTDIPIVFMAVSEPVAAGLLETVDEPSGTNVTGMYNFDPIPEQLDLALEISPEISTLGVIYNAGEDNSVVAVEGAREFATERGLDLAESTVASTNEVQTVAVTLASRVDAIFMPQDNTVVSALEALIQAAEDAGTPLYVSDVESVRRGAIATVGKDDYDAGLQAGGIVVRILGGEHPGDVLPEMVESRVLAVNRGAAERMGATVPEDILDAAELVDED